MRYFQILCVLCTLLPCALAQAPSRPRFATRTDAKEQKQAAAKPATSPSMSVAQVKQEILKLEHEWALALLNEDAKKLDALLADNLQYTRANGKVENKTSYLKPLRDGTTTYSLVKRDDIRVQVNGETAIVTARWKTTLTNKPNPPLTTTARYLHVYVKQNGRWLITTHQTTEIK
jgi:ketosteroid isomerase-like protein